MPTLPYSAVLYFFIIYVGIVWSDIEAILSSKQNFTFLEVIKECRERSGWEFFGKELPPKKKLFLYNLLVIAFLGVGTYLSWYFTESFDESYDIMYRICMYSTVLIVMNEIRNAYVVKLIKIDDEKATLNSFLESFDSKAAFVASERINRSLEYWNFFEQVLYPIEMTQSFAFFFSIFLIVTCFVFDMQSIIDFFRLQDTQAELTYVRIWISFAVGCIVVVIKLHLSYLINRKFKETRDEFLKHKNALLFIGTMPELFIQIDNKYDKFSQKIPMSGFKISEVVRHNYMMIRIAVSRIIWNTFLKETQADQTTLTNLKTVKENLSDYAIIMQSRLELVLSEYKRFFAAIEYKFLGIFTVDSNLLINLSVALVAPVSTYLLHVIYQ